MLNKYYVLDSNDITKIVDCDVKKVIMKKYGFKSLEQFYYVCRQGKAFNGYYFLQDEEINMKDIPFNERLFYENEENGYRYYADIEGNFFR